MLTGQEILSSYESSPNKYRYFCSCCGSPVYVVVASEPQYVRVRLGGLDFEPDVDINSHIYVGEKPAWHKITDNLPQYEGRCHEAEW